MRAQRRTAWEWESHASLATSFKIMQNWKCRWQAGTDIVKAANMGGCSGFRPEIDSESLFGLNLRSSKIPSDCQTLMSMSLKSWDWSLPVWVVFEPFGQFRDENVFPPVPGINDRVDRTRIFHSHHARQGPTLPQATPPVKPKIYESMVWPRLRHPVWAPLCHFSRTDPFIFYCQPYFVDI